MKFCSIWGKTGAAIRSLKQYDRTAECELLGVRQKICPGKLDYITITVEASGAAEEQDYGQAGDVKGISIGATRSSAQGQLPAH
jgi:hypothetical protein